MPRESILRDRAAVTRAVRSSSSMAETLGKLGLRPAGGNYKGLREACAEYGLTVPRGTGPQPRLPRPEPLPPPAARWKNRSRIAVLLAGAACTGSALALNIQAHSWPGSMLSAAACLLVLLGALI